MAKKRLLTWHKPSRRWKKQIDGVVKYFGYGKSESDTKAYKQAEQRYLDFMLKREQQQPVEIPLAQATVSDVCEKYLQQLEGRYRAKDLTAAYMSQTHGCIQKFLDFVKHDTPFSTVTELLLADYRAHVLTLPKSKHTGRPISPSTAKDRLSAVKALFVWAYEMRLCDLPRNLRTYSRIELPEPKPQCFTLEEIKMLWETACPRLRCFIALGLNCGYGQQDIADLRVGEIALDNGYIERGRSKTGVHMRHKLWPLTMELLQQEMTGEAEEDDLAFRTANGAALITSIWKDGKLKRSDSIKCMFWRLQKKTGINDGRGFYSFRKTGATEIEKINSAVTEMYLGHTEKGMKRNYAERDWAALDRALGKLSKRFHLAC